MPSYLFDTSAGRSVGGARLQEARGKGFDLLLSPITFWELVCHLGDEPFGRPRGNVRKVGLFSVLHDPLAEIAEDVGCPQAANQTRFDDREGVRAILAALDRAETYAELATLRVTVSGEERLIGDIANRTQTVFDEERGVFVDALRGKCASLVELYGRPDATTLSGERFAREATDLARGLREDMVTAGCDVQFATIAQRTLLGNGYCIARASWYIASGNEIPEIVIDGNDLEDYYIALHLGVGSGRVLVTNDEGTRRAIERTLAAFREFFAASGTTFPTQAEVISSDQFLTRLAGS